MVIMLVVLSLVLSSCSNTTEYWALSKKKPGVGRVITRTKGWTSNKNCYTYPNKTIQHNSYVRRLKNWKRG